jgi:hypothetical protein
MSERANDKLIRFYNGKLLNIMIKISDSIRHEIRHGTITAIKGEQVTIRTKRAEFKIYKDEIESIEVIA